MESKFIMRNPLIWGIVSAIFGVLLINMQEQLINAIIMVGGGLCLLVGVIQFIKFWNLTREVKDRWSMFPFSIIIYGVFGFLLLILPAMWLSITIRALGLLVMFLSLTQIVYLLNIRKLGVKAGVAYYIFPMMLFVTGVYSLINPLDITKSIMVITGVLFILYGVSDIINYFTLSKQIKDNVDTAPDAKNEKIAAEKTLEESDKPSDK